MKKLVALAALAAMTSPVWAATQSVTLSVGYFCQSGSCTFASNQDYDQATRAGCVTGCHGSRDRSAS